MVMTIILCVIVLAVVLVIHLAENIVRAALPGQSKTYIFQPVYRLVKLICKSSPNCSIATGIFSAGALWFSVCALYLAVSGADFLLIMSFLVMTELFIVSGARSTGESEGIMAARRTVARLMVWLFTCMMAAASLYRAAGTLNLAEIGSRTGERVLLLRLPLTFAAMLVVLMMKENLICFDFGVAGKELSFLDAALDTPYSGWSLALTQLARWAETGVWLKLLSAFLPWAPWLSFMAVSGLLLIFMLLDALFPKARWEKAAHNAWIWAGGMSVVNYLWLYLL